MEICSTTESLSYKVFPLISVEFPKFSFIWPA